MFARSERHPNHHRLGALFTVYTAKVTAKSAIVAGQSGVGAKSVKLVAMSGDRSRDGFNVFATIVTAMAPHDERFARILPVVDAYALYIRAINRRTDSIRLPVPAAAVARELSRFQRAFAHLFDDQIALQRPAMHREFDFESYETQFAQRVEAYQQQQRRKRAQTLRHRNNASNNVDDDNADNAADDDDDDDEQLEVSFKQFMMPQV